MSPWQRYLTEKEIDLWSASKKNVTISESPNLDFVVLSPKNVQPLSEFDTSPDITKSSPIKVKEKELKEKQLFENELQTQTAKHAFQLSLAFLLPN